MTNDPIAALKSWLAEEVAAVTQAAKASAARYVPEHEGCKDCSEEQNAKYAGEYEGVQLGYLDAIGDARNLVRAAVAAYEEKEQRIATEVASIEQMAEMGLPPELHNVIRWLKAALADKSLEENP